MSQIADFATKGAGACEKTHLCGKPDRRLRSDGVFDICIIYGGKGISGDPDGQIFGVLLDLWRISWTDDPPLRRALDRWTASACRFVRALAQLELCKKAGSALLAVDGDFGVGISLLAADLDWNDKGGRLVDGLYILRMLFLRGRICAASPLDDASNLCGYNSLLRVLLAADGGI